jgi:iron complex outermembrane receptor protein
MRNRGGPISTRGRRAITGAFACVALAASPGAADASVQEPEKRLADLSIEELLNEPVTSVSKKETSLLQSPAAVAVLTRDDLRRLGVTTLAEALRWVPGMQVGRISAWQWAVSTRGFMGILADKLLVLIDGRTIYESTFPGVNWDAQDVVLEDIDRIEVIRGPGATLWGANAVNGVINVITRSATETQGGLVSVAAGSEEQPGVTARYGGRLADNVHYRVYVKSFDRDGLVDTAGSDAPYEWSGLRGGFRLDSRPSARDGLTLHGDLYRGEVHQTVSTAQLVPPFSTTTNLAQSSRLGSLLGRWTRTYSETSELTVQTFFSHVDHPLNNSRVGDDTYDVELQHRFAPAPRHDVVWGVGYRFRRDDLPPTANLVFSPDKRALHLYTAFVQDEITLSPGRAQLILGSKLEHNDYTGLEVQPGARLVWTPAGNQTLWASLVRAVRTPDRFEDSARLLAAAFQPGPASPPVAVEVQGNPEIESETLTAYELGYRIEPNRRLSLDVAVFYNVYDDLTETVAGEPRFEAGPPPHLVLPQRFENVEGGESYGVELSVNWQPVPSWRLMTSYSGMRLRFLDHLDEFANPEHQLRLRSYLDLGNRWELTGAAQYVDRLRTQDVPSYVRLDFGLIWHPLPALEIGVWGQNLLDDRHPEATSFIGTFRSEVPRGVLSRITWRP